MNVLQFRVGTSLVLLPERLADLLKVSVHWDVIRYANYVFELLIENYVLNELFKV